MSEVTREDMIRAIYGQESSHGKADTSKENYARARGPMQVTHSTFEGMKANGLIPKDWKHDNAEHTKEAGNRLVGHLYDKYDGDPRKVAAAYYAGEKAVRADGSIADFRDKKNPKAPTTHQYADQVLARLGAVSAPAQAAGAPAGGSIWNTSMPGPRSPVAPAAAVAGPDPFPIKGSAPVAAAGPLALVAEAEAAEAADRADRAYEESVSFRDKAKAAWETTSFTGGIVRRTVLSKFEEEHKPAPGWKLNPEELAGYDQTEQEFLAQANSQESLAFRKSEVAGRRDQMKALNSGGVAESILASVVANAPEGFGMGLGFAKVFKVGAQASAAARTGAAVAENVGGNLIATAVQDTFDDFIELPDYAMAVGGGLVGTGLSLPFTFGGKAETQAIGDSIADAAAKQALDTRIRALRNVGTEASPEIIKGEVRRLEAEEVRQTTAAMSAPIAPERRLLPEEDNLRPDAEAAASDMSLTRSTGDAVTERPLQPSAAPDYFDRTGNPQAREWMARNNDAWKAQLNEIEGSSMALADSLPKGVHVLPEIKGDVSLTPAVKAVQDLADQFLKGQKVILGRGAGQANGVVVSVGDTHFIGVAPGRNPTAALSTAVHEVGHAVFHSTAKDIPAPLLKRMVAEHAEFIKELRAGKSTARFKRFSEGAESVIDDNGKVRGAIDQDKNANYVESFDEYTAEAFVRFVQRKARNPESELKLDKGVIALLKSAWEKVRNLWETAREKGYLAKDEAFDEYFERVMKGNLKEAESFVKAEEEFLDAGLIANFDARDAIVENPVAQRNGLDMIPVKTTMEQAEAKAITHLYQKAEELNVKVDEKRLSALMDTAAFKGAQSIANTMLRSANPVVRMVASELLESPSGAAGRRSTAAIGKYMKEREFLGTTLVEFEQHYKAFRDSQGGWVGEDAMGGKQWARFNRMVSEEIEARRPGAAPVESPPAVRAAADALETAYERMRLAQVEAKTVGWGGLPATSKGYMPHKMSPEKLRELSPQQTRALHSALRDQFMQIEGFDPTFSQHLATKYIDTVQSRALGGYSSPMGVHQVGAADVVENALEAMGLSRPEVLSMMQKYMKGGAGHTKKRLTLDLNAEHALDDGSTFKLMDLFDTDQFSLLRSQAQRVAGEVALARHGIMGKPGLKLLRKAMEYGAEGQKATREEIDAFDQAAAELMGEPFGTQNKLVDRVLQVNSLARLGGMGFTQFAEAINGVFHVGAARALDAVTSIGRLRSEIKALARGEKVYNPILGSLEERGAEFGTDSYKTVFPFDNGSLQHQTYGPDTLNAFDRLLRGGSHVQGKLSLWRALHATQQRGFAEQIVRKAAMYLKSGGDDVALRDMGIDGELLAKLRKDIDNIAEFDGDRLTNFDITKATDKVAAEDFVQAIHRGVSQIIQGTFTGETGRWSHDGVMRLMTQFRTFSLTSVEKQWARQNGNVGTFKALGMVVGSLSMAAPIYMVRTYLASIGRQDQEEYLERQLSVTQIAKASLNYIAMAGLAGDFLDATTAVAGLGEYTGGRAGSSSEFVGNMVVPAAGLANDVWKGLQNTKEGTDPHELLKALPFSRLPYLIPAVNALDAD